MSLIDLLLEDHNEVKRLFTEIAGAKGERRERLFDELRENLIRHEVAEEEIVRPLTKKNVPSGGTIADDRIAEESKAEEVLKEMEKTELSSPEWGQLFERLRRDVLTHAENEETIEFPALSSHVAPEELEKSGRTFETAKKLAPTHPHPGTPNTPAANMTLGPLAAIMDRARDAISKAKSA